MKKFDYTFMPGKLLTPEICNLLSAIHEFRGKQDLYITAKRDTLRTLLEVALIQSTEASNRIEGIFTSKSRLKELVMQKTEPVSRNEKEIAGYRDVLRTIHENYEYIPIVPNSILQLHRDLYSFQASGMGGRWKNSDNLISETADDGKLRIRFKPLTAFETPQAMSDLCSAYTVAVAHGVYDPLLLSVIFIFDFLCIHPFNDGNGRMSRLLTLLLLYQHGYIVGKYISLEMLIEKSKDSYYETLQSSSDNWSDGTNDYIPFVRYLLGTILKGYREFAARVESVVIGKANKTERIQMLFEQQPGKISKKMILEQCPDISMAMVEKTLKQLLDNGIIQKVGQGKSTAYVKR